jgi:hypothetical protein
MKWKQERRSRPLYRSAQASKWVRVNGDLRGGGELLRGLGLRRDFSAGKKILTGGVHLSARGKEKKRKEKEYRFG